MFVARVCAETPMSPDQPQGRTWTQEIRDVVVGLLPGTLKSIVEKGLLRALLVIIAVVVVLPPLVVLLAAFWLRMLGKVDGSTANALRTAYLQVITEGFSIEEIAARSNVRLDYLQLFEYELRPKFVPVKELRLSLEPRQKAEIDFRLVTFTADTPSCTLPENDVELISVFLGEQLIRTLRQESNTTIRIGRNWWQEHGARFDEDDLVQRLSFRLTDQAKQFTCGRVRIEGSVRVFKDLLPVS
jgi:hypothetical protein